MLASLDALFHIITLIASSEIEDLKTHPFWSKIKSFVEGVKNYSPTNPLNISYELIDYGNEILSLMDKVANTKLTSDLR